MTLATLLNHRKVLTRDEVRAALGPEDEARRQTRYSLLAYYQRTGRLVRARRGLYVVVPPSVSPDACPVDPYLLAAKAAPDAVLAYHTALEFHGRAYSVFQRFHYLSREQQRPWSFRGYAFRRVAVPKALRCKRAWDVGVKISERAGEEVRVTSLERTFVDVLSRPDLAGGYEEVWRSLESVEFLDLDKVTAYALLLANATTAAKAGYFLDQHRSELMVEEAHLKKLRAIRPRMPHYLERGKKQETRLVADWNLVVPRRLFERSWREER